MLIVIYYWLFVLCAGKSSLFQVLLRMRDLSGGRVLVDGVDIRDVPLPVLRRGLCLIPQSPVLFTGTVRDNVDLYGLHTDAQVWAVLEHCQMAEKVRTLRRGLRTRLSEQAEHFSVGQRQLLCFGRALLQQARVIMLDEASASLDAVSDGHIQRLTAGLKEATVIVIAHRISTVLSMEKVMVIEQARLVEHDAPHVLLQRQGGYFRRLVEQSNGKADTLS
jgi:ATP-binding cassette subfamily C (CFTR/MRP) protein 4